MFVDGALIHAAYARNPEKVERGPVAWVRMAEAVRTEVEPVDVDLVIEVPQVYVAGRSKGDPDDLLELAGVDGAITTLLRPGKIAGFKPREWKGQVPKEIHHARVLRKLNEAETAVLERANVPPSLRHNVVDAVALGVWFLRR